VTLILRDATHIDHETCELRRGDVRVEPGPGGGVEVLPPGAPGDGAREIDCSGRIVTRSFVVGHHHIYSALARGMPAPPRTPRSFVEILELIWWRLDRCLDEEMIRASAIAAGIEAALAGTTFVIDHHASPNAAPGSLGIIAEELDRVGLSHLLCYEMSDRDGPESREAGLEETERYLSSGRPGLVGMHASFTVSDDLLGRCVELAERFGTGVHVHVAEAASDEEHCMGTHGRPCVVRLREAGALDLPGTILAHCIHLDAYEREMVRGSGAWVAQQTESNQNNAVGILDAASLGERVMLGTDGMHGDCLAGARATYLAAQAGEGGLSPAGAYARLRAAHRYLEERGVAGDGPNNLVVLDYRPPTPITRENWPTHVVYGVNRMSVRHVVAEGRPIVEDGRCTLVDEDTEMDFARGQAERLWARLRDS
jgi:cytosine/adenosine deaminase-related metal-dependent hydrolase